MKKTFLKKCIDEFYALLNQKFDMKLYQVFDLRTRMCINKAGEQFLRIEAALAIKDKTKGKDYKVTKDFDL